MSTDKTLCPRALGIDFGTTNSALAGVDGSGAPRLARVPADGGDTDVFRSVLYFAARPARGTEGEPIFAGPEAVRQYRHASNKGRFMALRAASEETAS